MLVAGFVAALATMASTTISSSTASQGSCPQGYTAETEDHTVFQVRRCVQGTEELTPATENNLTSKEFLCQPALANFQCCFAGLPNVAFLKCADVPQGSVIEGITYCPSNEITQWWGPSTATVWCGDDSNACAKTGDFTARVTYSDPVTRTYCCRPNTQGASDCYGGNGDDICNIATPTYPCCFDGPNGPVCTDTYTTAHECKRREQATWCGDTDTTTLEPAAIAAIAVTPVLIIAAAASVAL